MQQNFDIPLHDIKPIVEVQEYSFYYLLALSALALFLVIGVAYLLYKYFTKRKIFNIRAHHMDLLKSISFDDAKKSAYAVTLYGATFKDDSPRHAQMFENITARLESYKYKKNVSSMDKETLGYVELYKEMCHA